MEAALTPALVAPLAGVAVILWNVVLAGWITSRREAPRPFTMLTAVCGMLVAPALVVAIASGTEAGSRTIVGITWLVPFLGFAFVLQVASAMLLRLVSPVVAVPILLYDLAVAAINLGDYLVATHGSAPIGLQAAVAARDVLFGFASGRTALTSPLAMLVPMIVPAYRARWRLSGVIRAVLVLGVTAVTTLLVIEWPRGIGAVRSYAVAETVPQARPTGDFMVGVRLFPVLTGAPARRAIVGDLAMADSIKPDVVLLLFDEDGTRESALDSVARVLEPLRSDSVAIAAGLMLKRTPGRVDERSRALAIDRILRRVRPDVLFPVFAPPLPPVLPFQSPSAAWWRGALTNAAAVINRVRPGTRMGWAASHLDDVDSAVYAWASAPGSPVELIGVVSFPSFSGLPGVDARLRAVDRWHANADSSGATSRPHWIVLAGGFPHAHGDAAQTAAILHAAAWGTRRPWMRAIIAGEPADYEGRLGLRAADGRARAAAGATRRLARVMRDARIAR